MCFIEGHRQHSETMADQQRVSGKFFFWKDGGWVGWWRGGEEGGGGGGGGQGTMGLVGEEHFLQGCA